jgi:purine-binding chemotaxis protein CheW
MSGEHESGPPSLGGLAEEMIPLLRKRLGITPEGSAPPPATNILDFAESVEAPEATRAAPVEVDRVQLVTFALDTERYGLPITCVHEILRVGAITRVPHAPPHVRGVMNVRGRLLPVVELRTVLGLTPLDVGFDSRVVMIEVGPTLIGLLVDRVGYVVAIARSAIERPQPELLDKRKDCIAGIAALGEGIIVVLDIARALGSEP